MTAPVLDWTGWSSARIDGFASTWRAMASRTLVLRGRGAAMRAPLRRSTLTAKFAWGGHEVYRLDGRTVPADDDGWLVIGAGELYDSEIGPGPEVATVATFFDPAFVGAGRGDRRSGEGALLDGRPATVADDVPLVLGRRRLAYDAALRAAVSAVAADPHPLAVAELLHVTLARILDAAADATAERARLPCVRVATRDELHRRVARAHDLLMSAYAEPLDLAVLAAEAAMAPHHFLRRFRDVFGVTPYRALVQRRIARARRLLAGPTPIGDIALAVGFETTAAFSTRFRRDVGVSPREYRARTGHRRLGAFDPPDVERDQVRAHAAPEVVHSFTRRKP